MFWASAKIKRARKKHEIALKKYRDAQSSYEAKRLKVEHRFRKCGYAKLAAAHTLGKAAEFLIASEITDSELLDACEIPLGRLRVWQVAAAEAAGIENFLKAANPPGAAAAAGVFGLTNLLGYTPTGVIMLTLSDAAKTNSTIAWLAGKGGVGVAAATGEGTERLGGTVSGPGIVKFGYYAEKAFEDTITKAVLNIAEMEVAVNEIEKKETGLSNAIRVAAKLNELLVETESALNRLLDAWRVKTFRESPPGFISSLAFHAVCGLFPSRRKRYLYGIARTARVLADLLDISLLDDRSRLGDVEGQIQRATK